MLQTINDDKNHEDNIPNSKVNGANMGPIWGRQDPGGPHVGPKNFAIWDGLISGVILLAAYVIYKGMYGDGRIWFLNLDKTSMFDGILFVTLCLLRQSNDSDTFKNSFHAINHDTNINVVFAEYNATRLLR